MNPRYTAEAIVMMLAGIAVFAFGAWALGWSSPLAKVWGALYGFFTYVVWRIIVDVSDTAMEEDGRDELDPLQALIALAFPVVVVGGAMATVVIGFLVAPFVPSDSRSHY